MRRRPGKEREVTIVRRRGKKENGHGLGESGAWKVAFADFTLAMMALFMVLWVVQPSWPEPKPNLTTEPLIPIEGGAGVFDDSSRTPLDLEGVQPVVAQHPEDQRRFYETPLELEELADLMRRVAAAADAHANFEVEVVPQGLRILIKDDDQRFMFERGSAVLDPHFKNLLAELAGVLATVENKLIVSGHTDATRYRVNAGYDNWNLSGDRALRARSVMVDAGLPAHSVLQVAAQADVMPLRPAEPEHGANRRVEILVLTKSAEALYRQLFGESYTQVHYSADGAHLVQPRLN